MSKSNNSFPQLNLNRQICHSLYSATNALVRAYRPLLEPLDLTYPQYLVLLALWEQDKVPIKTLVERTRLDSGTLTPILKRLEAKSLIQRGRSVNDERQKQIAVTDQGWQCRQACADIPQQLLCMTQMTEADAKQLKDLIETLYQQLIGEKYSSGTEDQNIN